MNCSCGTRRQRHLATLSHRPTLQAHSCSVHVGGWAEAFVLGRIGLDPSPGVLQAVSPAEGGRVKDSQSTFPFSRDLGLLCQPPGLPGLRRPLCVARSTQQVRLGSVMRPCAQHPWTTSQALSQPQPGNPEGPPQKNTAKNGDAVEALPKYSSKEKEVSGVNHSSFWASRKGALKCWEPKPH